MPALPFREDIAFVERVCRAGYRLRHPLDVRVSVSARLDGRAAGGMSDCLKSWLAAEVEQRPHFVENPKAIVFRMRNGHFYNMTAKAIQLPASQTIGRRPNGRAVQSVTAGPVGRYQHRSRAGDQPPRAHDRRKRRRS